MHKWNYNYTAYLEHQAQPSWPAYKDLNFTCRTQHSRAARIQRKPLWWLLFNFFHLIPKYMGHGSDTFSAGYSSIFLKEHDRQDSNGHQVIPWVRAHELHARIVGINLAEDLLAIEFDHDHVPVSPWIK